MVPPFQSLRGARGLRASSLNMHRLLIARAGPTLGSRPSASLNPLFVVVGTDRDRKTGALRALLAHPDSDGLSYAGAAFIALSDEMRDQSFSLRWSASPPLGLRLSPHG